MASVIQLPSTATAPPFFVVIPYVTGQSSDGATFTMTNDFNGVGGVADRSGTPNGSFLAATSVGANFGQMAAFETLAGARAAPESTASSEALVQIAKEISFATAGPQGSLLISLDPTLFDSGNAISTVSYMAQLDGTVIFSASATLDGAGDFAVTGAFSPSDFVTGFSNGVESATLVNVLFAVPITISAGGAAAISNEVGQSLDFEFAQTYSVSASDGGISIIAAIPEPTPLTLLAGTGGLLIAGRLFGMGGNRSRQAV